MTELRNLNLINLFGFYLAAMFVLGTLRRLEQYRAIGAILVAAPGRWPRLLTVMKEHRADFSHLVHASAGGVGAVVVRRSYDCVARHLAPSAFDGGPHFRFLVDSIDSLCNDAADVGRRYFFSGARRPH